MAGKRVVELNEKQRERFDKCWAPYVNRANKGQAEITWAKYDFDDAMTEVIHAGILEYNRMKGTKTMTKDQRKFIPHFSTFLNNKGWVFEDTRAGEFSKPRNEAKCQCGNLGKVIHQDKLLCTKCYDQAAHPDFNRKVYETLCKQGLGKRTDETKEQYLQRIKEVGMRARQTNRLPKNA